jgi:ABC-2 type transport system permease protein
MRNHYFIDRFQARWKTYSKYLRYVFNDHAVIALLIFLGALVFAYQQLWQNTPVSLATRFSLALVLLLTLTIFRKGTNFLRQADPIFLMADEKEIRNLWSTGTTYSALLNGLIQLIMTVVLLPMIARLYTTNFVVILLIIIALVSAKVIITFTWAKKQRLFNEENTELWNWMRLLAVENRHQSAVRQFFNLFIDVPGSTPQIKRRKYLDWLIEKVNQHGNHGFNRLMMTTFIRQNDFLSTWLRLTVIGTAFSLITGGWLLIALLSLLLYLLVLQLLPMMTIHQNLVFDHLFPVTTRERLASFRVATIPFVLFSIVIWTGATYARWGSSAIVLYLPVVLVFIAWFLLFWYASLQIKKLHR